MQELLSYHQAYSANPIGQSAFDFKRFHLGAHINLKWFHMVAHINLKWFNLGAYINLNQFHMGAHMILNWFTPGAHIYLKNPWPQCGFGHMTKGPTSKHAVLPQLLVWSDPNENNCFHKRLAISLKCDYITNSTLQWHLCPTYDQITTAITT